MKHKQTRAICIAAALALTAGCLPDSALLRAEFALTVSAEEETPTSGTCGENVTWSLEDGVLTISGEGAMEDYNMYSMPFADLAFTKAVISDGVTSIGEFAFYNYKDLTEITIADSVTSIGNSAFSGCSALTEAAIPESVTSIGDSAFSKTQWLETMKQENPLVVVNGMLIDGTACTGDVVIPDGVTAILGSAFAFNTRMTALTIPDSVTSIGNSAFYECVNLAEINIPESVNSFGTGVFTKTAWLTAQQEENPLVTVNSILINGPAASGEAVIPDDVTSINSGAFRGNVSLTGITIPESVTEIGYQAFYGCDHLTIRGYAGSAAETYANENNIPFEAIGGEEPAVTTTAPDTTEIITTTTTAEAAPTSGTFGENLEWAFDADTCTLTITGEGAMPDWDLSMGRPMPWYRYRKDIEKVQLPEGIMNIGSYAFAGCASLTEINIPESVADIGRFALNGTLWLAGRRLKNPLVIENGIVIDGVFCEGDVVIPDGVKCIAGYAFSECEKMTSVTLPDSLESIAECAFCNCNGLTELTIPGGVSYLPEGMCSGCRGLTKITIPESVTGLDQAVFTNCQALQEVKILNPDCVLPDDSHLFSSMNPKTLETTYSGIIRGYEGSTAQAYAEKFGYTFKAISEEETQPVSGTCGENAVWELKDGVLTISGEGAIKDYNSSDNPFMDLDFSKVIIEDGITSIGDKAFYGCKMMKSVTVPDSVFVIGSGAFMNCEKLTGITIPDSVEELGAAAFAYCTALSDVTFSDSAVIPAGAFAYCTALTDVIIPDGVTTISYGAFQNCTALQSITIPESVSEINDDVFADCSKLTVRGVSGSAAEAYAKQYNIPFEAIGGEEPAALVDGCLTYIIEDGKVIITGHTKEMPAVLEIPAEIDGKPVTGFAQFAFMDCDALKEVTLPDSVTSFGMQTFLNCKNLEKITLPKTLKSVFEAAFANCTSLKSVTIPDGCETIGNLVFCGCTSLEEINIPASVTNFYEPAFTDTPWLAAQQKKNPLVAVNGILIDASAASGEVTVPDGVKVINPFAFMGCDKITKITLPASVAQIDGIGSMALTDVTILNPDCVIKDEESTICNGYDDETGTVLYNFTIHGYDGSTAEAYADKYGRAFESLGMHPEQPVNDWNEKYVISKNTAEAELVVRVGDIDACNDENAAENGYDPFTAKSQYSHGYPWAKDEDDYDGTDRIYVGSKWKGEANDGYSSNFESYKNGDDEENAYGDGALTFTMEYDASGIQIENVLLQLCIDDFQAISHDSNFTVTLNGKDAPFIAELLNHTDQTGPTAYIVSAMIPSGFFAEIASGKLTVVIDETTGVGDGYAIDFARLLINYDDQIFNGTFSGKTEPGATVRLLGTSTTATASETGDFTFSAIPGINAVRASKNGFVENYDSGIVLSSGTEWEAAVPLNEGTGSPDIDFSKFAETGQPMTGDYDGNDKLEIADANLLVRFIHEDSTLTDEQITEILNHEPDYDGDGLVTLADVNALLRFFGKA